MQTRSALCLLIPGLIASSLCAQDIKAAHISQNTYLFCASEGLATGARASVDRKALGSKLNLRPDQTIILAQSVGYPKP